MPTQTRGPVLSLRQLNRALLARQMLLSRQKVGVVEAIERLGGLQAQWAPSPYVALWSRVARFEREQLTAPIDRGQVVKATLMRATLHLVSRREYPAYVFATAEGRFAAYRPPGAPSLAELERMHADILKFAATTPRTREEILDRVQRFIPKSANERLRGWLLFSVLAMSGLIWDPAGARFEHRQLPRRIAAPAALRKPAKPDAAFDLVVRRHLGAFGPASVADIASWSGVRVPDLRAALERAKDLVRFQDENGRELYDLRGAPHPDADVPAPARFLARFDAAILGHDSAERTRILPAAYKKRVIFAAEVWATFLVDGFVAGRYTLSSTKREAVLTLEPFKPLRRADKAALVEEGEGLVRFYYPQAPRHAVKA